jgi:hypothetical protein
VNWKKNKSQGKAVELTVNSKEENSEDFCLDFVQEFGLWTGNRSEAKERPYLHECIGSGESFNLLLETGDGSAEKDTHIIAHYNISTLAKVRMFSCKNVLIFQAHY